MQTGPNLEKLFLQKRLQMPIHCDVIKRYCAFYKGVNDEVVEHYEAMLKDCEKCEPEKEPKKVETKKKVTSSK